MLARLSNNNLLPVFPVRADILTASVTQILRTTGRIADVTLGCRLQIVSTHLARNWFRHLFSPRYPGVGPHDRLLQVRDRQ